MYIISAYNWPGNSDDPAFCATYRSFADARHAAQALLDAYFGTLPRVTAPRAVGRPAYFPGMYDGFIVIEREY